MLLISLYRKASLWTQIEVDNSNPSIEPPEIPPEIRKKNPRKPLQAP